MTEHNLLKDETLTQKLISKWFWMYLFTFLWLPLGYLIRILLSNNLSVGEVWIIYSLIWIVWLITNFSSLWLNSWALVYFLPKYLVEKKINQTTTIYRFVRYLNIFMTVLIWILLFILIQKYWFNYIKHEKSIKILYVFLAYFIFSNIANPVSWINQTLQNVFITQISWFLCQLSIFLWVLFFVITGNISIINASLAFVLGQIILYLIQYINYKIKYHKIIEAWVWINDKKLFKEMLHFWINTIIATNAMAIISNLDMQMLVVLVWNESAWYYSNYYALLSIATLFLNPILALIFPIISELNSKNDNFKLKLLLDFLYKYFVVFAFSMWLLLFVFGKVLSLVFFKEIYLYSGELLRYFSFFGVLQIIFSINFSFLYWVGKSKITRNIMMIGLIINLILNFLLIPKFEAIWAGIATVISWFIIVLFTFYETKKIIKIDIPYKFYLKNICIILFLWIIYDWIVQKYFILKDSYRLENLIYMSIMWIIFYVLFGFFNYSEIKRFLWEFRWFRK